GIFDSGLYDVDNQFAYTTIESVRDLMNVDAGDSGIHFKLKDPEKADEFVQSLRGVIPPNYYPQTWQQINPQFFEALWMEKVAMFVILLLIVLVAALNIIGTLVMTVVQKTRDIGIMKTMGATPRSILRIFLYHGFLIGI